MPYKRILLLFCFFLLSTLLHSHPHLFIKPSVEVVITNSTIKGIKITWEWDKWWSEDVINECDIDKNNAFDKKEIQLIYKNFFSGVKDFNYFTEIYVNKNKSRINTVLDFNASINKDNIVAYSFIIPLEVKYETGIKIKICFNDETIYTAFDKNLILVSNTDYTFNNLKISEYSYYGVQVAFEICDK